LVVGGTLTVLGDVCFFVFVVYRRWVAVEFFA